MKTEEGGAMRPKLKIYWDIVQNPCYFGFLRNGEWWISDRIVLGKQKYWDGGDFLAAYCGHNQGDWQYGNNGYAALNKKTKTKIDAELVMPTEVVPWEILTPSITAVVEAAEETNEYEMSFYSVFETVVALKSGDVFKFVLAEILEPFLDCALVGKAESNAPLLAMQNDELEGMLLPRLVKPPVEAYLRATLSQMELLEKAADAELEKAQREREVGV